MEETINHIKWCNDYIEYFRTHYVFDPVANQDREQEMLRLCCDYLYGIETALTKANAMFEAERNSIVFKA